MNAFLVLLRPFLGLAYNFLYFLPVLPGLLMEYTPFFHNHETGKLAHLV